jgi:hypothetical protein
MPQSISSSTSYSWRALRLLHTIWRSVPLESLEDFDLLFGEAMNSQAKVDRKIQKDAFYLRVISLMKSVPPRQICLAEAAKWPGIL